MCPWHEQYSTSGIRSQLQWIAYRCSFDKMAIHFLDINTVHQCFPLPMGLPSPKSSSGLRNYRLQKGWLKSLLSRYLVLVLDKWAFLALGMSSNTLPNTWKRENKYNKKKSISQYEDDSIKVKPRRKEYCMHCLLSMCQLPCYGLTRLE